MHCSPALSAVALAAAAAAVRGPWRPSPKHPSDLLDGEIVDHLKHASSTDRRQEDAASHTRIDARHDLALTPARDASSQVSAASSTRQTNRPCVEKELFVQHAVCIDADNNASTTQEGPMFIFPVRRGR